MGWSQIWWHPELGVMALGANRSDETLLAVALGDETAFAEFYARYERPVAAFFVRAVGSGEVAADLTAEVFAQALSRSSGSIRAWGAPPAGYLALRETCWLEAGSAVGLKTGRARSLGCRC